MLDENLPTYRFRPSTENPQNTLLYFTHNGSDPSPEYLLKRPIPSASPNQYALGLLDVQYASILYAEILLKPDWSQPTLSAAEVRANGGSPVSVAQTPSSFPISLYNPDQTVQVTYKQGSWSKDTWEFEVPERSFKQPSKSKIDQDSSEVLSDLVSKVNFKWKRDGRMNRDMTCYMSGKTVGGKKNKEPDITIALFKGGKTEGALAIYEPNLARVDVEDRKGLEVVLLLSAEVIRDLYLSQRQDPFNTAGAPPPTKTTNGNGKAAAKLPAQSSPGPSASGGGAAMSGALANAQPSSSQPGAMDARRKAEIDSETQKLKSLAASEQRQRDRERQDREEQERIKKMLDAEEAERKRRQAEEIEKETERLRKEYGIDGQTPSLPPRRDQNGGASSGPSSRPQPPARPVSVGPSPTQGPTQVTFMQPPPQQQQQPPSQQQQNGGGGRGRLTKFLNSPYAGPAGASVSGFFGGGRSQAQQQKEEDERKKKAKKKRSVHF